MIKSIHDIEGETSLLVHSANKCNFNCYGCHNREEIMNTTEFYTEQQILEQISLNGYFFDNVILSGSEITLYGDKLYDFILKLRNIYTGKIIVYTNGSIPNTIDKIKDIVDGFYMDIKLNLWKDDDVNPTGVNYNLDNLLKSVDLVYSFNKGFSQFRTVKYPIFTKDYLDEMKKHIETNYPKIAYLQNDFMEIAQTGEYK